MLESALPTYNNGSGTVVFLGQTGDTLDLFNYDDALQFALLKSVDGVSLERVDPNRPTSDNSNWHSAAEDVGYATPGYQNSQYAPTPSANGSISIEPAIFSPDNDGYQDLLTIAYQFDEPGFVGTMKVFDIAGREVRTLMNNELLGTSGAVSWDGVIWRASGRTSSTWKPTTWQGTWRNSGSRWCWRTGFEFLNRNGATTQRNTRHA
jgi:hypothetical protein